MFCITFLSSFNSRSLPKLEQGDKKGEEGGGVGDGRGMRTEGTQGGFAVLADTSVIKNSNIP